MTNRYSLPDGAIRRLALKSGELAFTYCQVPVRYRLAKAASLQIIYASGDRLCCPDLCLDAPTSRQLFQRAGEIARIEVAFPLARP